MKVLKNISDELWLGVVSLIVAVWIFAINTDYLLLSGVFAFGGIMLLIVDHIKKAEKVAPAKAKKATKKTAKK